MSSFLFNSIFVLFGLILAGYAANKLHILDTYTNTRISRLLVKITLPCMIISTAFQNNTANRQTVLTVTLIAILMYVLVPLISKVLVKCMKWENTYELMLTYSNLGFMGYPLVTSLYGDAAGIYVAIFMMMFNLHLFTFGVITLSGSVNLREVLRKLISPAVCSALLAYVIVLAGLSAPVPVLNLLSNIGSVSSSLAMIVIGSQLAEAGIARSMKNKNLYLMTLLKLAVFPAIYHLLLRSFLGNGLITQIATVMCALPVAGNVSMLCSEYDGNTELAAEGICISTLLSLLSLPVLLMVMNL